MFFNGKKNVSKIFSSIVTVFLLLGLFSCASSSSSTSENNSTFDSKVLVGTWFWDYSFNQDNFSNDQLTLNKDGTFETYSISPEFQEWDKGTWSVITDEQYGPTLVLKFDGMKERIDDSWDDIKMNAYYAIYKVTEDELFMGRFKRDFSEMGWGVQHFENPIANNYFRVKKGDADKLPGTWHFNKRSMPGAEQNETWTIEDDGTIKVKVNFPTNIVNLEGTYDVDKKSVLHISFNKANGKTLSEPEEYWYEYNNVGENLINVNCLRYVMDGKDTTFNEKEVNFFYRDLSLVEYRYHVSCGTQKAIFFDKYPFNMEYEPIGLDKIYLMDGIPGQFVNHVILGWYDNPEFNGEPVKIVAASDSFAKREFWAKWTLRCARQEWSNSDGTLDHNHGFELPMVLAIPDFKVPSVGDTVKVIFYAKTDKDINGWGGLNFCDYSNSSNEFTDGGWRPFKTNNKTILEVYELKINDKLTTSDINQIGFRFGYDSDALDESCIFEEYKFEIIDENSSVKTFEHTLNYCGFEFKKSSASGYPFYLPEKISEFRDVHWTLYNNTEIAGWYDNPEFKGNPVDIIFADQNTKSRKFYGKPDLKFYPASKNDDGTFYSNCQILLNSVIPNAKINPKAGDVVKVALSANVSKEFEGKFGLKLTNRNNDFDLGDDWHWVKTENGKLETYFEIPVQKDSQYTDKNDATLIFAYNPYAEGEVLVLSDVKIEFVDKNPYPKDSASTKHMKIEPCNEGFKFTFTKAPEDKNQWQWNMGVTYELGNNCSLDVSLVTEEIDKNGKISFIWPFVEKGKDYVFTFKGSGPEGRWFSETVRVNAQNGKGELNYKAYDPIEISLDSNSKEANLYAKNLTAQGIMELVNAYKDDIAWVSFGCPIISGKNDWSDSEWLFKPSLDIFPEINGNSFYIDLMKNGKANLFGDYNLGWGDAQKINNALLARPTFWTRLDVNFRIKQNSDCVEFVYYSNTTDNIPYVPVKF